MPQYLKLFEELALPAARRHFGEPLGYYVTQIGPLNQVVHLWGSIGEVSRHYGFTNPGRFATAYRRRFGESAADTVRRGSR